VSLSDDDNLGHRLLYCLKRERIGMLAIVL
jgi:hypothetical protein